MNKKRLFRLYREEDPAVRRRRGPKRAIGSRQPMALPDGPGVADRLSPPWALIMIKGPVEGTSYVIALSACAVKRILACPRLRRTSRLPFEPGRKKQEAAAH